MTGDRDLHWQQHEQQIQQAERAKNKVRSGKSKLWELASAEFLSVNQYCADCNKRNYVNVAEHVFHIECPAGDRMKFWDVRNWQSLCKDCFVRISGGDPVSVPAPVDDETLEYIYTVK
ncbi:hypothetical protein CDG60_12330 [Acinetobacter chinensis]|uniref:HNH endonuclease n=1 Tax=Acinetobacter chinensis TaxID=2004650 RepID=A0A3B7LZC4_9GAMM|nr:hypothetical protein [Acinetobacter chinensis]AXY57284.1 hypothetical protein CDG60_12330 [Acinetobacter chinensis]